MDVTVGIVWQYDILFGTNLIRQLKIYRLSNVLVRISFSLKKGFPGSALFLMTYFNCSVS